MIFTEDQLAAMLPGNPNIPEWYNIMELFFDGYEINTPERVAAFISQCAHESGNFRILKENLNYSLPTLRRVFPKYFPTDDIAKQYVSSPNKQEAIASRVYANRMGNGSEETCDGYTYCGRGLIQLTGKNNYQAFASAIGFPVEEVPEYLTTYEGAIQSACWFWETNNLNRFADVGDVKGLTKAINGGFNGLEDRIKHYNHALSLIASNFNEE